MAPVPNTAYPQEVVRGTFFEHDLPIDKIFVHFRTLPDGYARPLSLRRMTKLISEFDRQALGVLLLSMRPDGTFACIDGQHRWEACKFKAVPTIDALVYIDLSLEDEARLYRKFGDYLKQTPLDKYHAALAEKVPDYLYIQRILSDRGLFVPIQPSDAANAVVAVEALLKVSRTYGPTVFESTIDLIHNAWNGEHRAYRGHIIQGTAMFLARYATSPKYASNRLISRMTTQGMSTVERRANSIKDAVLGSNPHAAWGQALVYVHDKGIPDERQLGDWIRRHISEQNALKMAQHMRDVNAAKADDLARKEAAKNHVPTPPVLPSAPARRRRRNRRGFSYRDVACPLCHAMTTDPCITENGKIFYTYHAERRRLAETNKRKP